MFHESQTLPNPGILNDIQILVVDSDADNQYFHKTLLEIYGAQVTTLESIADALVSLDYLIPDILICDIRFFGEDILSLIQRIKTVASDREREIPILVVSAYCSADFARNLLTMIEDSLLKPIDINHLVNKVWNLVHLAKSTQKVNSPAWVEGHRVYTKCHATATKHLATSLI